MPCSTRIPPIRAAWTRFGACGNGSTALPWGGTRAIRPGYGDTTPTRPVTAKGSLAGTHARERPVVEANRPVKGGHHEGTVEYHRDVSDTAEGGTAPASGKRVLRERDAGRRRAANIYGTIITASVLAAGGNVLS